MVSVRGGDRASQVTGHGDFAEVGEGLLETPPRLDDRANDFRFVVRDRVGQFTASLDSVLADAGIDVVKIPAAVSTS